MPENPPILVTGSSGLIGSAVIRRLAEQFRIVGFDRAAPPHPPPQAEAIAVDLSSDESVHEGFERVRYAYGGRIESVIHLAAYYDFSGEPSDQYEQITVRGTQRLLRHLREFEVGQFVFSSTMLVHAPCQPGERIDEDWPIEPKWDYPKSKVEAEKVIHDEHGDVPAVILRVAGVYTDRCQSIPLAHQMQRIYERKLIGRVYPGDIGRGQAFVHLNDLVETIRLAVEQRVTLPAETVMLIGEDETLSYDQLQRGFAKLMHGEEWETTQIPKALAKTGAWLQDAVPGEDPFIKPWMIDLTDDHYELDISRARRMLGWQPKRSLRLTLPAMVAALKADPPQFYRDNKLEPPGWLEERAAAPPGPEAVPHAHHGAQHSKHATEDASALAYSHRQMIAGWRWRDALNITLGVWLLLSPATFGYTSAAMAWNDIICGMLIIAFAAAAIVPRLDLMRWGVCIVGLWLLLAPLVFWAPEASAYANDTLVGALVIAFSVLIPMMPGRAHHEVMMLPGPETPPGWSYNPSDWIQRGPIIAMAFVGFFISRYLAAYQLGHINHPWDPFFGSGTRRILDSDVSKAWPISDAGLGATSYMLEALSGFMGGVTRWRTMPWMVLMFGILVIPLGVVSIVLVILQPVAVGAWCTLCLVTAAAMLIMITPALDEIIAMGQFLMQARREGQPLWRTFWLGGTLRESEGKGLPVAGTDELKLPPRESTLRLILQAMDLTSIPWNIAASAMLGVWLMFSPSVFTSTGIASNSDHLVGALVVTFSVIAFGQVARPARLLNILFGACLIAAPWIVAGFTSAGTWNDLAVGVALIALSLRRGTVSEQYGGWERYIV